MEYNFKYIKLKGKKPVEKWQENQYTFQEVYPWVTSGNPIGLVVPHGLIVVDIDSTYTANTLLANISLLGNCGVFKTPRGLHLVYSSEGTEKIKNGSKVTTALHDQVDYRTAGKGYIVYPSIELDRKVIKEVPAEPDKLPDMFKPIKAKLKLSLSELTIGARNDLLYKHAIRLYNEKFKNVPSIINTINQLIPSPLEEGELKKSIDSAKKFVAANPPKSSREEKTDFLIKLAEKATELFKFDHHNFYIWNDSYWVKVNQTVVNKVIYELTNYNLTQSDLNNVISKLKAMAYTEMKSPDGFLNTKSGAYNPETKELRPATMEDNFTHLINAEVTNTDTTELENILAGMTPDIQALKMLLGTILHSDNRITEKAFMLIGNKHGQNGKDTFLTLVEAVFNMQQIEFNELGTDFSLANIENALVLADSDFNGRNICQTSVFKKIVSGSTLEAKVKFVQESKRFVSRATIIVNTNMFPIVDIHSVGGFFRRWCVLSFPNDFSDEKKRDPLIKLRMGNGEFNNALFKLACQGYELIKENNYRYPNSNINEWADSNNPLNLWIRSEFTQDKDSILTTQEVYDKYRIYCEDTGVKKPLGMTMFIRAVKDIYTVTQERRKYQGKRVQVLLGIKAYEEEEEA